MTLGLKTRHWPAELCKNRVRDTTRACLCNLPQQISLRDTNLDRHPLTTPAGHQTLSADTHWLHRPDTKHCPPTPTDYTGRTPNIVRRHPLTTPVGHQTLSADTHWLHRPDTKHCLCTRLMLAACIYVYYRLVVHMSSNGRWRLTSANGIMRQSILQCLPLLKTQHIPR